MTKPSPSAPTQGLQRYDHDQTYRGSGDYDCNGMRRHDTGVYVEYDDHLADKATALSALVAERDRLLLRLGEAEAVVDIISDGSNVGRAINLSRSYRIAHPKESA